MKGRVLEDLKPAFGWGYSVLPLKSLPAVETRSVPWIESVRHTVQESQRVRHWGDFTSTFHFSFEGDVSSGCGPWDSDPTGP